MKEVSVSVLCCDFLHLYDEITKVNNDKRAATIHLDIMDGIYVPNISFGFNIMEQIHSVSTKPCIAHLMISDPLKYISKISEIGIKEIIIHLHNDLQYMSQCVEKCDELGINIGIALNPEDSPGVVVSNDMFREIYKVLIMTVKPGFGGQKFDQTQLSKIEPIKKILPKTKIEIDGGVKFSMLDDIKNVDSFVIGTDFFKK